MTYTPELDTPQPTPEESPAVTKKRSIRFMWLVLGLMIFGLFLINAWPDGPMPKIPPRAPLSITAVKVASLVKEHPEEWQDALGGLHNETRGITIDYGTRMQDWNDIGDGTTLSVRVGPTTIPAIKADRENQFLRGVVDVQSADQQIIYEQLKRWHSETLESQVQQRAIDEATAIKKLMDEPA